MTVREFLELPDDGNRCELIEGELVLNASSVLRHQRILRRLMVRLDRYFEEHGGGEVLNAPCDVILNDDNALQPDLLVVLSSRAGILREKNVQGPPNIAIEILSTGTRRKDEVQKKKLYERFGVDEYWIVDHELEVVKIYRATAGTYGRPREISVEQDGTAITSPLLPGFSAPLARVFA
jgi:Uma2 family endonuclease